MDLLSLKNADGQPAFELRPLRETLTVMSCDELLAWAGFGFDLGSGVDDGICAVETKSGTLPATGFTQDGVEDARRQRVILHKFVSVENGVALQPDVLLRQLRLKDAIGEHALRLSAELDLRLAVPQPPGIEALASNKDVVAEIVVTQDGQSIVAGKGTLPGGRSDAVWFVKDAVDGGSLRVRITASASNYRAVVSAVKSMVIVTGGH